MEFCVSVQKVEVDGPLVVGVEEKLARVATLGDVVRNVNCDDTGEASHHLQDSRNALCLSRDRPPGTER